MRTSALFASAALAVSVAGSAAAYVTVENAPPRVVYVHVAECHNPTLPAGDTIDVDPRGNASAPASPAPGDVMLVCTSGQWVNYFAVTASLPADLPLITQPIPVGVAAPVKSSR
jgi:hypothetical protein